VGRSLSEIPDPWHAHASYADHNNHKLMQFLDEYGFDYEFMSSTECYTAGKFDQGLMRMAECHDEICDVVKRTLQKERRERQKLEKEIANLQKQQEEARQAELSEVEKLREQLEATKREAEAALSARSVAEQQSLVRTSASQAGFTDVGDAITFVNFETLSGLEGEELTQAVADEVQRVSEEKPYLLANTETNRRSVGKASDREGAEEPPLEGEDALGGFVHNLLFGKK
jgi:hypothetical protein